LLVVIAEIPTTMRGNKRLLVAVVDSNWPMASALPIDEAIAKKMPLYEETTVRLGIPNKSC
jgi:hypothetical protein